MFFFFSFRDGAVDAFRRAIKAEGITYDVFAKRIGVSRGTITKFIGGRPLSSELLGAILRGFPADKRKEILTGYLRDEMLRAGYDPTKFLLMDQTAYTPLLGRAAELLPEDSERVVELMNLVAKWEEKTAIPNKWERKGGGQKPDRSQSKE